VLGFVKVQTADARDHGAIVKHAAACSRMRPLIEGGEESLNFRGSTASLALWKRAGTL